ncbi:PIG-L deacetylase family protein [Rhodopila globiformis]|uniref:PIG-L family deacetylase n=1 Tax=Rhodopila globiformis TaxID=1071 RepID=A0A2S6N2S6_RHOGL|nr:PIG-L family deacetylase [Rhodopila globiformis]PPQ28896.1 PIG-L family deacetylase [Rhodopila globiformis]
MSTAADFHACWRVLPVSNLDTIIGNGTCLVLAPHPDDESLGCGGLIAACVAADRAPLVAFLTDGAGSHAGSRAYPPARLRTVRAQEAREAAAALGLPAHRLVFLEQPDTAAPHHGPAFDAVVAKLLTLVRQEAACTAIVAPWRHDPHCDHEAAAIVAAAVAGTVGIRSVAYPVWGWTLPADTALPEAPGAGWRLDVAAFLAAKRRAIQAHRSQFGGLITDDPNAFSLPADLLSIFDSPCETFLAA